MPDRNATDLVGAERDATDLVGAGQELFLEQPPVCRGSATKAEAELPTVSFSKLFTNMRYKLHGSEPRCPKT